MISRSIMQVVIGLLFVSATAQAETEKERQQWEQKEVNNYTAQRNSYNRAYGACLDGRGYSVK